MILYEFRMLNDDEQKGKKAFILEM